MRELRPLNGPTRSDIPWERTIIPLQISPDKVMPVSGWLQFRIEGTDTRLVLILTVTMIPKHAEFDGVTQFENDLINLTISAENSVLLDNRTASIKNLLEYQRALRGTCDYHNPRHEQVSAECRLGAHRNSPRTSNMYLLHYRGRVLRKCLSLKSQMVLTQ